MDMKFKLEWLTPLCLTLASQHLYAASIDSSSAKTASDAPVLNTVVVHGKKTASKKPESSVTTITSDTIKKNLNQDLTDLFRHEPGVDVTKDSRFGVSSINVRGLDENRVYLDIDGVAQPDSYNPTTTYLRSGRAYLDLDSVEQVDVLKGGDVVTGSGALAGSVKFKTKDPDSFLKPHGDDSYLNLKSGYSSASEQFHETATMANRTGDLESMLVVTRRDGHETESDGSGSKSATGASRGRADPSDVGSGNFLGKLAYQVNDDNKIGLVAEHYQLNAHTDLKSESSATSTQKAEDAMKRDHVGIWHENKAENAVYDTLKWQLDYQKKTTENGTHVNSSTQDRYVDRTYDQSDVQFKTDALKQVGRQTFKYGVNYTHGSLENLNKNDVNGTMTVSRFSPKAHSNIWGGYVEDNIAVTDDWHIIPAARYDNYSYSTQGDSYIDSWGDNKSHALTEQIGTEWAMTPNYTLFAKYGTGFRAPAMEDLYYYYENAGSAGGYTYGYIIEPNPDLKPERSVFLEGGLRTQGDYGSTEITTFYNRYRNFIEQESLGTSSTYPTGIFTNVNIDRVVIKGIEAKSTLQLSQLFDAAPQGLHLMSSIAYADGKNETDNEPLNSVSPLTFANTLGFDAPTKTWGSALTVTWRAAKKASDITEDDQWQAIPSSTVLDLTAYYRPLDNVTLNAGLFNLTNEKYWLWNDVRQVSNSSANLDRYSQPGRNVGVSVDVTF
jgi:hemoglobin/transferrin/lactoferrin receptor protein